MRIVSVIVPVYKVEPYLHRCVDSILGQTFMDHEPLLVDDGSPDNSGEICEEYAVADSRVIVIHQKNGGLSCARNTGIDWAFTCSDSEWITFVDSDDWVNKRYLTCLYNACDSSNIAMCAFQTTNGIDYYEDCICPYYLKSTEEIWVQKRANATVACGKLFSKDLWKNIRFPLNKIYEDTFTIYKLLFALKTISVIDSALYYYYQNPAGITKSEWSPKRLDAIEAASQISDFFLANGNMRLYLDELKSYLDTLAANTVNAKVDAKYRVIHQELKKKLRFEIKKYKKDLNLTIGNNIIYVAAYPRITYLYCITTAIVKKLTIRLRSQ